MLNDSEQAHHYYGRCLSNDNNKIGQRNEQLSFICLQLHIIVVHVDLHTVDTQVVVCTEKG